MIREFWLKLKSQRYLLPLLLIVVAFQLLLSMASGYVLADKQPPLSLAVQQHSSDALADELLDDLSGVEGFTVTVVDSGLEPGEVFRRESVQGLLIIPEDFAQGLIGGNKRLVTFHVAPGITNPDFATEQITAVLVQLKAPQHLDSALANLGAENPDDLQYETGDLLDVSYDGPAMQSADGDSTPVFGVAALLVLLVFLHAALTAPSRDDKQLLVRGRKAFIRQLVISLFLVWLIWTAVIAMFFVLLYAFSAYLPSPAVCLAFIAVMFYSSLLAAVLTQIIGRHRTAWVFVPLFLLSMTVGGGLWGNVSVSALFAPLIPVAAVQNAAGAGLQGVVVLAASCLCAIVVMAALTRRVIIPLEK